MAVPKYIALILRVALLGAAITMAALVNAPPMAMMGLALLTVAIVGREFISGHLTKIAPWMVLTGSCLAIVGMTIGRHSIFTFNSFFAFQAWLIAAAVFPQHLAEAGGTARAWKVLTIGWIFLGSFVLLGDGYLHNIPISFYAGLAAMLGLALWTKRWFRLRGFVVQILNTIILLIVGLPIVDALTRPRYNVAQHPDELRRYYSYSVAKKNPEAFRQWEEYSAEEWRRCEKVMIIREPTNFPSFRLRPNTRMKMFQAEYVINSLGFRGREIPVEKGNTYRIVAMGESTTFGISLTADHHPWPELLEGLIRERLKLSRPVEVINAGVPGATLPENIARLRQYISEVRPDLIISYHGYNGFRLLDAAIPPARGKPPPAYKARPVKLLADFEYGRKLNLYKSRMMAQLFFHTPTFSKPLETRYASAYRDLIELARTNHLRLVMGNFSMAANVNSDPGLIEFYRQGWPIIQQQVKANVGHSQIVQELCASEPWICFVDTHPNLDGENEKFIDLVHFDKGGEEQMAETFFAKIRPLLEEELAKKE